MKHNLDVIRCADWIIDLGPDEGDKGGEIVVVGTPETVADHPPDIRANTSTSAEAASARGDDLRVGLEG